MKKLYVFALLVILSACNTSTLSFSEIETVPDNVQDKVDPNLELQSITDDGKGYYIVFHSSGNVKADLETEADTVKIILNVDNPQADVVKQNTFYLTTDPEHDVIDVLVNGKSTSFDNVIVQ